MVKHSLKVDREDILKIVVYPLPVWWLLGLEQLLIYAFGLFTFLVFLNDKKKKLRDHEAILVLFLVSTFISAVFVYHPSRLLEVVRSTIAFITIIFGSRYIGSIIKEKGKKTVLKYVFIISIWSISSALIGFFLKDFTLIAPIEIVIPGGLKDYSLIRDLYYKRLGDSYFSIFGPFWRPRGIYSYSTALSVTLAVLIPMMHQYKLYVRSTRWVNFTIFLGIVVIILTTTRIALIALIFIYIFYGLFVYKKYRMLLIGIVPVFLIIVLLLTDLTVLYMGFMEIRGVGSTSFRANLYITTFEFFKERPFFGWAAQIPHEQFYAALGSHSAYLNILFCYGVVGFLLFSAGITSCISKLQMGLKDNLLLLGGWIAFLVVSITQVFHVDFITVLVFSNLIALTAYRLNTKSTTENNSE